ncbi:tetratricopeptide repeat protein [Viridibacillus sp. YIM B01967]|uniref:Tetratricopeptide repeat protein n=1 Tax=Viridibacillus soli TaxID=2798301 RepID=A0ABS1HA52_9BACL|nr:tetratricopeptide repeat protein [Viridibacillus soli]MBK3496002.1 tetratricopeptide repeat protein [Viridibacillus soli]
MEKKRKLKPRENVVSFIPTGDFYYNKALQALDREQFDKAHKYLQRAAELSPEDSLILMQYAITKMELDQHDHALELLRKAHSIDPDEPEIVLFLAEVSAHLGMTVEAGKYAKRYLELDTQGVYSEEALEIIDFAEQMQEQPTAEEPQDAEVVYLQEKARRMMEEGNFKDAIELFEKIIEENPDFWAAHNNLSLAYFYLGETEQARALLHQVLKGNFGNLHALCNLTVMAYYEKNKEELEELLELLVKIQPYSFEHRYKLGATLALVGRYGEAYKWLRSLQKRGFEGDPGFYFWLSHAAYFSGKKTVGKSAWKKLLEIDPEKEGFEPWAYESRVTNPNAIEQNREYIVEKLESKYRSDRLFGLYLVGKTIHKQEIIAHPSWIDVDEYSSMEKLFLAYALEHEFDANDKSIAPFLRAMEVADILYMQTMPITMPNTFLFQMWFVLCERALDASYPFKNPKALAAAADYMYKSSRMSSITKTSIATVYGITTATLSKYVNELIKFLPVFDA